ncbi:MAG: benzoylformate decarboxylase [Gaiellaceae bacterium]|nr:benzoylformate decarboxylase [Gaiellaceae bacterium]
MALNVRDATFDVFRRRGLTTLFSNPGSTEIPFLTGLPEDLEFVLGLHEGAVVSMASGYALARRRPSLVLLHTTAGLGNAVNAIATARVNRTPLVILVGQQDRRHIAFEPFLTGRLEGLAGQYPVWVDQPLRAQSVPGAIERAYHEAETRRGPALVVVPMSDWLEEAGEPHETAAPQRVLRPGAVDEAAVAALAELVERSERPALVAGARLDTDERWAALVTLAERLGCPVYQEAFSGQAGFPQDHPQWAGLLPFDRTRLRDTLEPYDLVLAVGAPVFRQAPYHEGPFTHGETALAVVTDDPDEAHRSPVELAVLGSPDLVARALAAQVSQRPQPDGRLFAAPGPPSPAPPLKAAHVFQALGDRLPADVVLVEECPSNQVELTLRVPARRPLGFVSAAMGGLGWGLSAATGLRMGLPDRPVVAVLGDGSTMFGIHGLWSAARYGSGTLFVVLKNGGYRIMDQLAALHGGAPAWPSFDVDIAAIARGLGCDAVAIGDEAALTAKLDEVVPSLRERTSPLLLELSVEPD